MSNEDSQSAQGPPSKKQFSFFRLLRRFIVLVLIIAIVIITSALAMVYYYQKEVKDIVITELNKQLNTQVIIDGDDIDFTVLKSFPFASVNFKNIKILDATEHKIKDTLFKAQQISLLFNIVDVYNKNYHIKKIKVKNAYVTIKIDAQGNDNYHFLKDTPGSDTTNFSFALEEINFKEIHLNYSNKKNNEQASVLIHKSKISGAFSDDNYSLEISSDILVNTLKFDNVSFLHNKNIHLETSFDVDNITQLYTIKEGRFNIENMTFETSGSIHNKTNEAVLDIGIKGKGLDIKSVLSLIPNAYKTGINDYKSEGNFYFNAQLKGSYSGRSTPQLIAEFGINNATITQTKDNIVLHHVNLKGSFSNGKKHNLETSVLKLIPFSAVLNNGQLSGELTLTDFNNLLIDSKINANIALTEFQNFAKLDTVESISGQLNMNVLLNGKWDDIYSVSNEKTTITGSLKLSDMNLKIKNNSRSFTNINGDFNFDNNNLIVNELSGNISNSDFNLSGVFKNIIGFIFKENQKISVIASLKSKNIDLNELLSNKEENTSSQSKYKLRFSEHVDLNLNSEIEHLYFRKFDATAIKGMLTLKDKRLMADPITLSTMSGSIVTSGIVDASDSSNIIINCFSEVKKINITKMFIAFENFGQTAITDKNIKGVATANIQFTAPMNPELDIDMDKLYANITMTVENGELNNVEEMKNLSRYVDLKELLNIRFSTLKNQFEIKNRSVYIPKMEMNSNALNITVSGTHSFNNEINYKIKLNMDELLFMKARKNKKENDDFGQLADDGLKRTNIFLSMTGTVDNPIVKYDTKEAVQNFKENLKTEKQSLKAMLKEEFSIYKKDSTVKQQAKKEEPKFNIDWEEKPKVIEKKKELKVPKRKVDEEDF